MQSTGMRENQPAGMSSGAVDSRKLWSAVGCGLLWVTLSPICDSGPVLQLRDMGLNTNYSAARTLSLCSYWVVPVE